MHNLHWQMLLSTETCIALYYTFFFFWVCTIPGVKPITLELLEPSSNYWATGKPTKNCNYLGPSQNTLATTNPPQGCPVNYPEHLVSALCIGRFLFWPGVLCFKELLQFTKSNINFFSIWYLWPNRYSVEYNSTFYKIMYIKSNLILNKSYFSIHCANNNASTDVLL